VLQGPSDAKIAPSHAPYVRQCSPTQLKSSQSQI